MLWLRIRNKLDNAVRPVNCRWYALSFVSRNVNRHVNKLFSNYHCRSQQIHLKCERSAYKRWRDDVDKYVS